MKVITGLPAGRGLLGLSAFLSVLVTIVYWINKRRNRANRNCENSSTSDEKFFLTEEPNVDGSDWMKIGRVEELYCYPLKSGRGMKIHDCIFTDFGISVEKNGFCTLRDRMLLVYSGKSGKFQTGRQHSKMLLVNVISIDVNRLRLEADGMTSLIFDLPKIDMDDSNNAIDCSMWWGESLKCIDCGPEPAKWISKFLKGNADTDFRLGLALSKHRNILKGPWKKFTKVYKTLRNEDTGYFADLASYMLMNESSLERLNERLERSVSSLQFRPNIVVSGCEPFAEDNWEWIKIGDSVLLRNVKPCPRCSMILVDPNTGQADKSEPLKTLRSFREQKDPERVNVDGKAPTLGIYCGLYRTGPVKIGDPVYIAVRRQ